MTTLLYANFAKSTLAFPLLPTDTSAVLAAGTGSFFPQPIAGEGFYLTFQDAATGENAEIVLVTSVLDDTIVSMVRAQQGTTAQSWAVGDIAAQYSTAGDMQNFIQSDTAFVSEVTAAAPIISSGGLTPEISIPAASATTDGYLTAEDWVIFNAGGAGGGVVAVYATSPLASSGGVDPTISITQASGAQDGYLSSADYSWFANSATNAVYSISFNTANGLAAAVLGTTNNPVVTLRTTVSGIVKGNGTSLSAASAGVDYALPPSGSSLLKANGSGGFDSVTVGTGLNLASNILSNAGILGVTGSGTVNGITLTSATVSGYTTLTLGGSLTNISLTSQVSGVLPIANGGTNSTATPTAGGVAYGTGSAYGFTSAGTSGQVLVSQGAAAPVWQTVAAGGVTSVTGTAPISSSGGATPAISISQASASTNGYLSSTDWSTFNNKGSGTVTSVSIASANGFAGTSSGGATPTLTLTTSIGSSIVPVLLKANGTAISAAVSGTDYAPSTSGSSILAGNSAGGFNNVTMGTGLALVGTTLRTNTSGSSILYGNGSGGFSNVTIGSGLTFSGGTLSASGGSGTVTTSGSPTINYLTKFTSSSAISNSQLFDDGTNVGIGTAVPSEKLEVVGNIKSSGIISTASRLLASGAGSGSIFGHATLLSIEQTNDTPWALTLRNTTAGASYGFAASISNSGNTLFYGSSTAGNVIWAEYDATAKSPILYSNGVERLRIATTGAWGLSGANYGTSGQVLVSQGSGSPPIWSSSAGSVSGSGTAGLLPLWSSTSALTDSSIYESSGKIGIGQAPVNYELEVTGTAFANALEINGGTTGNVYFDGYQGSLVSLAFDENSYSGIFTNLVAGSNYGLAVWVEDNGDTSLWAGTGSGSSTALIQYNASSNIVSYRGFSVNSNFAFGLSNGYGTSGQVLTSNGSGSATTWTTVVSSVTASSPLSSSGGGTPNISIPAATTSASGYLTSTDWNTFNDKQAALVSGTNIKTVNGGTLLGSGNLSVGTVTSVGLSMPSAFTVTNSPVTGSGTLTVTGAGTTSQYIRGDGQLADFPTNPVAGGAVTYYFNGGTSQTPSPYKQLSATAVTGNGTNVDFSASADGYIAQFITDSNVPNVTEIPAGSWNFSIYMSASSVGGTPNFYVEVYKYDGSTFTSIASSSTTPEYITGGTSVDLYYTSVAMPQTTLALTDRIAVRVYVVVSGRTITMHTQDSHLCQLVTNLPYGLSSLNGLTATTQYFATGTSGSDFGISSATNTHTFNLPTASSSVRGALSSTDWTTFNSKQAALVSGTNIKTINSTSLLGSGDIALVSSVTGTSPIVSSGGTTPAISIPAATGSVSGYLTSSDWNTFNGKQTALSSGSNIKTVNGNSILGSGDLSVGTVTSVSGTAPVVSSGGTTPTISMAAASGSTDGYLTSTDWNTFNNKGSGTISAVTTTADYIPKFYSSTQLTNSTIGSGIAYSGQTASLYVVESDYDTGWGIVLVNSTYGTSYGFQFDKGNDGYAYIANIQSGESESITFGGGQITLSGGGYAVNINPAGMVVGSIYPLSQTYALEVAGAIRNTGGIVPRTTAQSVAAGNISWASDSSDQINIQFLSSGSFTLNADSNTSPLDGQKITFRISGGTFAGAVGGYLTVTTSGSRSFGYRGVTLPNNLFIAANTYLYMGCIFNSTANKWDVVALTQG